MQNTTYTLAGKGLGIDLDEIMLPCWFVEVYAKFYCAQVPFKGENSASRIFMTSTKKHRHLPGHFERICLKLWMMLNTSKLYCLILVGMTLMFTQGYNLRER